MQYEERDTKTRKNSSESRPIKPRLYATLDEPETCLVNILIEFTHRRPMWYKIQPLGVHSLGSIMKNMAELGELPGRKTNHSGRKTTVKRLKEANFENAEIIQLTGHKNVQSLNSYSTVPTKIKKRMSETLTTNQTTTSCNKENGNPEIPADEMAQILSAIGGMENQTPVSISSARRALSVPIQHLNIEANFSSPDVQNLSSNQMLNGYLGLGTPMFSGGGQFTINISMNSI